VQATRKRKEATKELAGNSMVITPLGAGNEVGRSCIIVRFKQKTIMVRR
jgi:cleavage and polyadenylation specificity factor subunit 3